MNLRHLLERLQLARQLFDAVNLWLSDAGIMVKQGTLVDAEAPCSTKNKRSERDGGDAPDQERQLMVLRHEGSYRCRCQEWPDAQSVDHGSQ